MRRLLLLALLASGCAHAAPSDPPQPVQVEKVFLPAHVPDGAWFCVEDYLHTRSGWRCNLTVADIRRYVAGLQAAE